MAAPELIKHRSHPTNPEDHSRDGRRASNLQAIFKSLGPKVGNKYGASTTHMEKLLPRIEGGGGGGCPILALGITSAKYVEDNAPIIAEQASENGDEDSE